jgi:hypothetical protein
MEEQKDFTIDQVNYKGLKEYFDELRSQGMRTVIILVSDRLERSSKLFSYRLVLVTLLSHAKGVALITKNLSKFRHNMQYLLIFKSFQISRCYQIHCFLGFFSSWARHTYTSIRNGCFVVRRYPHLLFA